MISTRVLALIAVTLVATGCKKKPAAGADSGTGDDSSTTAAASDDGGAADSASGDDGAAEAAADTGATGEGGADQGDDGGASDSGPTTPTVGGAGYGGTYSCFGTLKLTQTGNTVSGDGVLHAGARTETKDLTCKIMGDRCTGVMNAFNSMNGGTPKPAGRTKVTFRIVGKGLEYNQVGGGGGGTQQGFCQRL
jgi:hypothetical protein